MRSSSSLYNHAPSSQGQSVQGQHHRRVVRRRCSSIRSVLLHDEEHHEIRELALELELEDQRRVGRKAAVPSAGRCALGGCATLRLARQWALVEKPVERTVELARRPVKPPLLVARVGKG